MSILLENIHRRTIAAGHMIEHAEEVSISTARKSAFFRSASILLTTVIEGMIYEFVKKNSTSPHVISQRNDYRELHKLPSSLFSLSLPVYLCEKNKVDLNLDDNDVGLGKMIIYLKNNHLITPNEYKLLNWARIERNKIHPQSLSSKDTGYTKVKIDKLGKVIEFLVDKIK